VEGTMIVICHCFPVNHSTACANDIAGQYSCSLASYKENG